MSEQFAVIGLGRYGTEVALWLSKHGYSTLVIDINRERVQEINEYIDNGMIFDSTNEQALRNSGITNIDTVVCAIGDHHVQNNILTTALLKEMGVKKVIARASTDLHARILKLVGADEVVNPEQEMGKRTAQKIATPGLTDLIPLTEKTSIVEIKVPKSFVGKNIYEMRIRSRYGVNVIGVRRLNNNIKDKEQQDDNKNRNLILNFKNDDVFKDGDILIIVGEKNDVEKFTKIN